MNGRIEEANDSVDQFIWMRYVHPPFVLRGSDFIRLNSTPAKNTIDTYQLVELAPLFFRLSTQFACRLEFHLTKQKIIYEQNELIGI